jgi:cellobiose transport system substrate-binding protein
VYFFQKWIPLFRNASLMQEFSTLSHKYLYIGLFYHLAEKGVEGMRRKKWILLCMGILLSAWLAGCGDNSGATNPDGTITLTLWYWNRSMDDELLKRVEQQFPNIRLRADKIGGDFKAKLMAAFAARSGAPDIVGLNDWVAEFFPNREQFVNLFDLGSKELEPLYLDWKWNQTVTPDGEYQIALPMDTGPTALFYREDLFRQAGLPTEPEEVSALLQTWDDYIAAGVKLKETTGGKVYMFDNINTVFNQVLSQSDKLFFDTSDEFIGDQEHVKRAWDLAAKAHELGLSMGVSGWTAEWNAAMNNGDIASFIGAVWMKQVLMEAAPDTAGKWRIARAPGGDGNNGGSFVGIPKQSKHPKEAYEVIKWLQNPENQLNTLVTMNLFPSTPEVFNDPKMTPAEPYFGNQPTNEIFKESAKNVKTAYRGPKFSIANSVFGDLLSTVEKQNADPEQTWKEAIKRINKELLLY